MNLLLDTSAGQRLVMFLLLFSSNKFWLGFCWFIFVGYFLFLFISVGTEIDCPRFVTSGSSVCPFQLFQETLGSLSSNFIGFRVSCLPVISSYCFDLLLPRPACGFFMDGSCIFMAKYFMGDMRVIKLEHHPVLHNTSCYSEVRGQQGEMHPPGFGDEKKWNLMSAKNKTEFGILIVHLDGANKIWGKFIVLAMTYWDVLRFVLCKKWDFAIACSLWLGCGEHSFVS